MGAEFSSVRKAWLSVLFWGFSGVESSYTKLEMMNVIPLGPLPTHIHCLGKGMDNCQGFIPEVSGNGSFLLYPQAPFI